MEETQFNLTSIKAKTLLSYVKQPDTWFGLKYGMNLYRGCQHQCIYCDTRSECYQIENFENEILIKENAIELLRKELASKRKKGVIGLGSMNDPYMPVEKEFGLTAQALEVIAEFRFPIHIITKSDLVLKDLQIIKKINKVYAAVSFTVTTADDELAKIIEPAAPSPSERFRAMKMLSDNGILSGVVMMPILPFIEDNEENISNILKQAHKSKAKYIIPSFGMTLRNRQREYYYKKLDKHFPGLRRKYIEKFGDNYGCSANNVTQLKQIFERLCHSFGISQQMILYEQKIEEQLSLF